MNFALEADSYANRFPALTKVMLNRGAVEFEPLLPADDITLLATSAALVVRLGPPAIAHHPALLCGDQQSALGLRQGRRPGAVPPPGHVPQRLRPRVRRRQRDAASLQDGRAADGAAHRGRPP
ncbi:MAG: hypothetical protein WDN31_14460 [Hyphomicrobium sp.]